jgi:hypothetical protein
VIKHRRSKFNYEDGNLLVLIIIQYKIEKYIIYFNNINIIISIILIHICMNIYNNKHIYIY